MRTKLKEVSGIDWCDGAVMNCQWRGPRLRDVLLRAGLQLSEDKWRGAHVAFACFQTPAQDDEWYGGSIELERAMRLDADVILALDVRMAFSCALSRPQLKESPCLSVRSTLISLRELFKERTASDHGKMNDAPLPTAKGFPVRIVAPGIAGARSVKWLDRITVQLQESCNFYQQRDYKVLPPEADCAAKAAEWWPRVAAIQDMPVNSVIGEPETNARVQRDCDGRIQVRGYALPSGEDGPVVKVDVSADEGQTWQCAELLGAQPGTEDGVSSKWAWSLWRARVQVEKGAGKRVLSRATDRKGNVQPACPAWNFRGVVYNGYGEASGLDIV